MKSILLNKLSLQFSSEILNKNYASDLIASYNRLLKTITILFSILTLGIVIYTTVTS